MSGSLFARQRWVGVSVSVGKRMGQAHTDLVIDNASIISISSVLLFQNVSISKISDFRNLIFHL